jgi:hypothetical protein
MKCPARRQTNIIFADEQDGFEDISVYDKIYVDGQDSIIFCLSKTFASYPSLMELKLRVSWNTYELGPVCESKLARDSPCLLQGLLMRRIIKTNEHFLGSYTVA